MTKVGLVIDSFDAAGCATLIWAQQYLRFPPSKHDQIIVIYVKQEREPKSLKDGNNDAPNVGPKEFKAIDRETYGGTKWVPVKERMSSFEKWFYGAEYKGEWVKKVQNAVTFLELDKLVVQVTPQGTGSGDHPLPERAELLFNSAKFFNSRRCTLLIVVASDPTGLPGTNKKAAAPSGTAGSNSDHTAPAPPGINKKEGSSGTEKKAEKKPAAPSGTAGSPGT